MIRRRASQWAILGHRVSGLALAAFVPVHFLVLGLALEGADPLDGVLAFGDLAWVKLAEWVLLFMLGLHLAFGVRVLVIEYRPIRGPDSLRAGWIAPGVAGALVLATAYLLFAL